MSSDGVVAIDGVTVTVGNVRGLVLRHLRGELVFARRSDLGAEDGLARLLEAGRDTDVGAAAVEALVAATGDEDATVASAALATLVAAGEVIDGRDLLAAATRAPRASTAEGPSHRVQLATLAASKPESAEDAVRMLEDLAANEAERTWVAPALAAFAPGWVLANASTIVRSRTLLAKVLFNLPTTTSRVELVEALAQSLDLGELRGGIDDSWLDPEEKAAVLAAVHR